MCICKPLGFGDTVLLSYRSLRLWTSSHSIPPDQPLIGSESEPTFLLVTAFPESNEIAILFYLKFLKKGIMIFHKFLFLSPCTKALYCVPQTARQSQVPSLRSFNCIFHSELFFKTLQLRGLSVGHITFFLDGRCRRQHQIQSRFLD